MSYEDYEWHLSQIRWHEKQLKKYQTAENMIKFTVRRNKKLMLHNLNNNKFFEKIKGML